MVNQDPPDRRDLLLRRSHIPNKSLLFDRIIPILLILLAVVMASLILFAAGVLLGFVHF